MNFNGAAKRLTDTDLPELGSAIGVGEDELHAFIDTETLGHGFDASGRPIILFEPHIFYRYLAGEKLGRAVESGLAYPKWGEHPYPKDSYPRLLQAISIDETAALKACSWGIGQILGANHAMIGYATPQLMVEAFCDSERAQVKGIVDFLIANHLDDDLRAHRWATLAEGYNGRAYAKNGYDKKLEANFHKWQIIKDTDWRPQINKEAITAPPVVQAPTALPAAKTLPAPISVSWQDIIVGTLTAIASTFKPRSPK